MTSPILVDEQPVQYDKIPVPYMRVAMERYIERGILPGSFLTAVLANDLMDSAGRADSTNLHMLREWAMWLFNYAPPQSFGSRESVAAWVRNRQQAARSAEWRRMMVRAIRSTLNLRVPPLLALGTTVSHAGKEWRILACARDYPLRYDLASTVDDECRRDVPGNEVEKVL